MSPNLIVAPDARDLLAILPEVILTVWGLVVLSVDFGLLRRTESDRRRQILGWLSLSGVVLALLASVAPILHRVDPGTYPAIFPIDLEGAPDTSVLFGTIAVDNLTEWLNFFVLTMLAMVVGISMSWSFTETWGEYFSLLLWSTVGMLLLIASEDLLTLFLTLELMTICLYLATALEKSRRRSAEGGLKYFVYGSVSSALFLFGLSWIYGLTGSIRFEAIRLALTSSAGGLEGLDGNVAAAIAILLLLAGFGFKVAAVPFHQWAPDVYEGSPAPVTAWIATGSKVASFVAMMKVMLNALGPWASSPDEIMSPGWIGILAALSALTMTYGNFAALAQRNLKRMLAYSSIAHAGYMLIGVLAAGVSVSREAAAGSVLFYLIVYGFSNLGAFAVAAWLVRDKGSDEISDLNGIGSRYPGLAVCIVLLMLSLIGMPPLAGFFAKVYMFAESVNNDGARGRITLMWLVALGLFNSVVSAFYYVRVLKAMFLRDSDNRLPIRSPTAAISIPIVVSTLIVLGSGLYPSVLLSNLRVAAIHMLSTGVPQAKPATASMSISNAPVAAAEAASLPAPIRRGMN